MQICSRALLVDLVYRYGRGSDIGGFAHAEQERRFFGGHIHEADANGKQPAPHLRGRAVLLPDDGVRRQQCIRLRCCKYVDGRRQQPAGEFERHKRSAVQQRNQHRMARAGRRHIRRSGRIDGNPAARTECKQRGPVQRSGITMGRRHEPMAAGGGRNRQRLVCVRGASQHYDSRDGTPVRNGQPGCSLL